MICAKCGAEIVGQPVECPNCGNVVNDNNITYVDGYRMIKNGIFTFLIVMFALFALITGCFSYGWRGNLDLRIIPIAIIILEIIKRKVSTSVFSIVFILDLIWQVFYFIRYLEYLLRDITNISVNIIISILFLGIKVCLVRLFVDMVKGKEVKKLAILLMIVVLSDGIYYMSIPYIFLYSSMLFILVAMSKDLNKDYVTQAEINYKKSKGIPKRSIGISLFLSIVTFGIYYIYGRYTIIRDIRSLEGKKGSCIGECLLIIFIPFYDWYWLYTRANKLSVIGMNNGVKATGGGFLFVFLDIICFGWINAVLMQTTLNALANRMDENFVYGDIIQNKPQVVNQDKREENVNLIYELNKMKENGIITEEEFETKKKEILSKM